MSLKCKIILQYHENVSVFTAPVIEKLLSCDVIDYKIITAHSINDESDNGPAMISFPLSDINDLVSAVDEALTIFDDIKNNAECVSLRDQLYSDHLTDVSDKLTRLFHLMKGNS